MSTGAAFAAVLGAARPRPERLARAQALIDRAGRETLPYPSREATNLTDGALLHALELLQDPEWLARHVLAPDPEEGGADDG